MSETVIVSEPSSGVRVIAITRPTRKNALDRATYEGLTAALAAADADAGVRAIVLTGTADCFTAGNDLADFLGSPKGAEAAMAFLHRITDISKPIIAAVEGVAVGIGVTMLLHCDLAYAGRGVRFRVPFVPLGVCAEGASSLLLDKMVGRRKAAELLLAGEFFSGEQAAEWGLVNAAVEDGGALAAALAMATKLAALPPGAIAATKALMRRVDKADVHATLDIEAKAFAERLASSEAQAAFAAFLGKK